ncbi:propionyl-coenzyme A carboxylase alpha polypeptide [Mesorhizobium sp. M7A.F.Ca.US.014.04.1.1]|nr:propionyl-coenzyme A carboxylase alpha polypeptide [Mesorhizobium sp. Primo-B]RUU35586.1 propionyl-coenzyme A carboxylase alpha polypeptide [Mesorhizobium sp. Primo-A]RUX17979.1 propionyl-coenzyme A carboxylase alpha polypeptide [Mesorhizobium sp. M7A.F.Ca.CA.002.14.1.2]RUX39065.1 propionyl-coenzyme A carboxylase alpha polypeptide [Mesorhizobium sp. M7A.F.Ca.CA.002.11.2.1]RUX45654.1 propionyl-coenzyme A carboxylase alpha polypeptide [Mesorhizobium sp. M7A.F.Ca.CA.002.09.1.1]RUX58257.1 propi
MLGTPPPSSVAPPLSCRTSPPQGGRLRAQQPSPNHLHGKVGETAKLPISPLEGEMPGRARGA